MIPKCFNAAKKYTALLRVFRIGKFSTRTQMDSLCESYSVVWYLEHTKVLQDGDPCSLPALT